MLYNYEQLLDKISKMAGIEKEEINRKVEAKRAKLSGLISKEGAAQIVAAELGINFDREKIKINEIVSGMKRVNLVGKIIRLFQVKEFNKNNRSGKIGSFNLADDSGNIRVVLWDVNHIDLIEKKVIKEGDVVEISNAGVRNSEVHLTSFSDIKISNERLDKVNLDKAYHEIKIKDIKNGENVIIRGVIVQAFPPRFFEVCPECKHKVEKEGEISTCSVHGKVVPEKRALMSLVLDDGSESMRAILFNEAVSQMKINLENFNNLDILGKEMLFSGNIRQNRLFNNLEFFPDKIEEVDLDKLIEKLEGKA